MKWAAFMHMSVYCTYILVEGDAHNTQKHAKCECNCQLIQFCDEMEKCIFHVFTLRESDISDGI